MRATNLRAERGGVLVEVMVSAVILVVVAGATFKAIDAASSASAKSKTKSVATSIAQKYMDDLRAQDPIKLSAAKSGGGTEVVDGITYTYATTAYWVRDATQDKSCDGNPGDYMKLSVTVTWTGMTASDKPVKTYSIVTAPNGTFEDQGNLAVKILGANNVGVPNIPVSLTSPTALSDTTDANGCAFFANINPGSYSGNFSKTGYVDPNGKNAITGSWTVSKGGTTVASYAYDQAATANVNTVIGGTATSTSIPYVSFNNSGRTTPLEVGNGTPVSSFTGTNLFPFTSPYAVYAGRSTCAGNSSVYTLVTLPTGSAVTVPAPPLKIQVQKDGTNIANGTTTAWWKATQSGTGCVTTSRVHTAANGTIATADNGWPAAAYSVCVDFNGYSPAASRSMTLPVDTTSTTNVATGNATTVNFNFKTTSGAPSNGSTTACP